MWLKVASTNNNPAVIAQYFIDCVKQIQGMLWFGFEEWSTIETKVNLYCGCYLDTTCNYIGAPRLVRSDCGTENVNIEVLQTFFTNENGFRYGTSISNQVRCLIVVHCNTILFKWSDSLHLIWLYHFSFVNSNRSHPTKISTNYYQLSILKIHFTANLVCMILSTQ